MIVEPTNLRECMDLALAAAKYLERTGSRGHCLISCACNVCTARKKFSAIATIIRPNVIDEEEREHAS